VSYYCRRYSFSNITGSGSLEECQRLATGYPVGSRVSVFYDPDRASDSVLKPGADWSNHFFSGVMATLLVGGLALIWAFLVRPLWRGAGANSPIDGPKAQSQPGGTMQFRFSRSKALGFCALGLALGGLGGSVLCLAGPDETFIKVVAAALVFFGALVIAIMLYHLTRSGPVLSLSPEGLDYRRLDIGLIPWDEIDSISLVGTPTQAGETVCLCLTLKNPDKYLSRLPFLQRKLVQVNRQTGYGEVTISFVGLTPGLEEAWGYVVNVLKPDVKIEGQDGPEDSGEGK
jgi:hypothetical protein